MAIADEAGLKSVQKIDSDVLPHAAKLANDIIQNASVLLTGAITALDGERIETVQDAKNLIEPILAESTAWRDLLAGGFEGTVNGNIPFTIKAIKQ